MSHTIKPVQEDNQQLPSTSSPANQNSNQPQDGTSESVSLLSDADYEFLFNQLLEGIAHGWHDRRIIRFFQQLGDRGKQEDWTAWLERLHSKVINLPLQSKRQLGTMMIRLGELTQASKEVTQIGTVSMRLGRELLFGNTEDLIWEYAGPDLVIENKSQPAVETDHISQRLPEDFTDLGATAIDNTEPNLLDKPTARGQESSEKLPSLILEDLVLDETAKNIPETSDLIEKQQTVVQEASPESTPDSERNLASETMSEIPTSAVMEELPEVSSSSEPPESANNSEFEFETSEPSTEPSEFPTSPESESTAPDPIAIDMEQVMNLIQEDEQLAKEISHKLNYSVTKLEESQEHPKIATPKPQSAPASDGIDQSSIELIEGWFNLGLKQVSAGEFDKAIASWEKALKINPNLSEAWHNRGSALGRLGKYQEAVLSFQKALSIDPDNYQAWNDRAHALYQLQDWSAAADSWSNAIKLTPGNHLFWYNRGCALEQLSSWAESIASYEKALEIKPDFQPARTRYTNLIADNSHSN